MLKYLLRKPLLNASVMCAVSLPANARLHFDPSMLSGDPVAVADLSLFHPVAHNSRESIWLTLISTVAAWQPVRSVLLPFRRGGTIRGAR
jgi:hypothetical protein